MQPSKHNILTQVHGDDRWVLVNLLSKEADVLEPELGARLSRGEWPADDAELASKGYLVEPAEEAKRYRAAYLAFADSRLADEVQLFYVPSYACNFDCSYCFQDEYATDPPKADQAPVVDAFLSYVDAAFAGRRKYVTLFGGEPLAPSPSARRAVEQIVRATAQRGLDLAVVTNGYALAEYVPLLTTGRVREVQVTLDGPAPVHDARRHLKGGGATFARAVEGIDACLQAKLPVNLRTVLDRTNVRAYAELARFARERGWTESPLFKTQIGRNYELHHCQSERAPIYTRLELYEDLYRLAKDDPEVLAFHRPAFSVARFLFENGELPEPLFDACPACKTEWAFDYTGKIYPCTANVGKPGEAVGTFYPERRVNAELTRPWLERDVLGIDRCRDCASQLACGGGCGAVSKNRDGTVLSPDCRPVAPLLSLGAALYGGDALK
jgi:uncharacterized protein